MFPCDLSHTSRSRRRGSLRTNLRVAWRGCRRFRRRKWHARRCQLRQLLRVPYVPHAASFLPNGLLFVYLWISVECQGRSPEYAATEVFTAAVCGLAPQQWLRRHALLHHEGLTIAGEGGEGGGGGYSLFNSSTGLVWYPVLGDDLRGVRV